MNRKEKQALLARLIELSVHLGEDISGFMGRPLSYFDYDKIKKVVEKKEVEYNDM